MTLLSIPFYRPIFFLLIIISCFSIIFSNTTAYGENDYQIPEWVKINANWWDNNQISDDEFESLFDHRSRKHRQVYNGGFTCYFYQYF